MREVGSPLPSASLDSRVRSVSAEVRERLGEIADLGPSETPNPNRRSGLISVGHNLLVCDANELRPVHGFLQLDISDAGQVGGGLGRKSAAT